jgi:hypothetical protein
MRISGLVCATLWVAFLNPTYSYGQSGEQHRSEEQTEPYHKHHDTRHGHDHVYPDRGAIVRDLPRGTIGVNYAGVSYRYHDGIWLEPRGPAFMVVTPPIGLVVPTLPTFSTTLAHGGETYLYANDTYYRPRPDLAGYEVVNDPAEAPAASQTGPDALVGGQLPGAAPATQGAASTSATPSAVIAAGIPTPVPGSPGTPPVSAQAATGTIAKEAGAFPPPASAATTTTSTAAAIPVPVTLPTGSASASSSGPQKGPKVFLYPKNGQSPDQQARDRYDCYRFAVAQSGFDPMRGAGGASPSGNEPQSDFDRAQSACFEARGYASR